jgi:hypothetical protein
MEGLKKTEGQSSWSPHRYKNRGSSYTKQYLGPAAWLADVLFRWMPLYLPPDFPCTHDCATTVRVI